MHDVSSRVYISGFHINSIVFHISLQFNKYLSNFIYIGGGVCARELIREKPLTVVAIKLYQNYRIKLLFDTSKVLCEKSLMIKFDIITL